MFTSCLSSDVLMFASCFSSDPESVDWENFPEKRMHPDYSWQRHQQVSTLGVKRNTQTSSQTQSFAEQRVEMNFRLHVCRFTCSGSEWAEERNFPPPSMFWPLGNTNAQLLGWLKSHDHLTCPVPFAANVSGLKVDILTTAPSAVMLPPSPWSTRREALALQGGVWSPRVIWGGGNSIRLSSPWQNCGKSSVTQTEGIWRCPSSPL